jgi:hypothetical protein
MQSYKKKKGIEESTRGSKWQHWHGLFWKHVNGKNVPTSNKNNITKEQRKEWATYIVDLKKNRQCNKRYEIGH